MVYCLWEGRGICLGGPIMGRRKYSELKFCSCIHATIQKKFYDDLEKDMNEYALKNDTHLSYFQPPMLYKMKQPVTRIHYKNKIGRFEVDLKLDMGRMKKDFEIAINNLKKLASKKGVGKKDEINGWIKNFEKGKIEFSKENRNSLFLKIHTETIGKVSQNTISSKKFLDDFIEAQDIISILNKYKWNYKGKICVVQSFNKDEFKILSPFPLPYSFSLDPRTENLTGNIIVSGLTMTFNDSPIGIDTASFKVEDNNIILTTKFNYKAKTLENFLHKNFDLCEITRKFFMGLK